MNADRIFVLNEGHLSESGSFAELSEQKDSLFGTMWQDYQQSVRWKVEKEVHEIDDKMASAVTAALEDVTNRKFTKNMQQKKEEKISN